jgi:putative ABC transport system permease protein
VAGRQPVRGAAIRELRNPFRSRTRGVAVVLLLALVMGFLALMVQAAFASREQIGRLDARVRTLVELREAGAFGTGGFGGDKPMGEHDFTVDTLDRVRRIPSAAHLARVDEYVYTPQVDVTRPNAYAMVIGLRPGAAMLAIGEVDYENARIVAGRGLTPAEAGSRVAVVGRLYARQRLAIDAATDQTLAGKELVLNGQPFAVVGVYTTGNDFGDNHVFIPMEAFRATFNPGQKLTKIFVTVDSVANVERVVAELKDPARFPEADVVIAPEAVSTARTTLGSLAMASAYAAVLLFAIGAVLIVFAMVLSTRERVREIGTLKAIGAGNAEVVVQFLAEAVTVSGLGGAGALIVAALAARLFQVVFGVPLAFDARVFLVIVVGSLVFAGLGSLYPVIRGIRLSPVEAMRSA